MTMYIFLTLLLCNLTSYYLSMFHKFFIGLLDFLTKIYNQLTVFLVIL